MEDRNERLKDPGSWKCYLLMGICSLGSSQQRRVDNVAGWLGGLDLFHQDCGSQLWLLAGKFGWGGQWRYKCWERGIREEGRRQQICIVPLCACGACVAGRRVRYLVSHGCLPLRQTKKTSVHYYPSWGLPSLWWIDKHILFVTLRDYLFSGPFSCYYFLFLLFLQLWNLFYKICVWLSHHRWGNEDKKLEKSISGKSQAPKSFVFYRPVA